MPRIPKEQIPEDMPAGIRKHVEGLYDIRDDNVCLASVKALGEMGPAAAPAAPFLASVLDRHKTCPTPNAAVDALVRIGKASVEPTILALKVGDAYGRTRAIRVLRQLKDPRAVPALVNAIADGLGGRDDITTLVELGGAGYLMELARDPNAQLRQVAMRVLPRLATPESSAALCAALGDTDEKVRQLAIHGLNDVAGGTAAATIVATNAILAALKAPDAETRRHTLRLVMRLNFAPDERIRVVAPMLSDADSMVLADVVSALGRTRTEEAANLLRGSAEHPDPLVRAALATALGDSGRTSAVDVVEGLLADRAGIVREHAAGAIATLQGQAGAERLAGILRSDGDPLVRRRILQVLGGWTNALAGLDPGAYMTDADESVRMAALDLAAGNGTHGIAVLVKGLQNDQEKVREYAANLLQRNTRPTREAAALLIGLLGSPLDQTRLSAIRLLARDPSLIDDLNPVLQALDDADSHVRSSAMGILGQRRDKRRIEDIRAAAKSTDEELALSAVGALILLSDSATVAAAASHPLPRVRNTALEGLARMGTPEAQKALADLQKRNTGPDLRPVIASAIAERSDRTATPEMLVAAFAAGRGQVSHSLRTRLIQAGTNATGMLSALLTNEPPALRSATLDILRETKDKNAIPAVRTAADDPSPDVRLRALQALASFMDRGSVDTVCAALDDESPAVSEQAVITLGAIADPSCLSRLLTKCKSGDWHIRGLVLQTAGRIKDSRAAPALREALQDPHWHVRGMAAEAIAAIADRASIPALIARLDDPHWSVKRSAAESLRSLTGQSMDRDADAWKKWWRESRDTGPASDTMSRDTKQ